MHVHNDILLPCNQHVQTKGGDNLPKKGQKLTDNPKNVRLDLRLTQSEADDLRYCADKLETSRTHVINLGVQKVKAEIDKK